MSPSDLTVHRQRRSGLKPLHSVGGQLFVEDDRGAPVEVELYVASNGAVTARKKGDTGTDQSLHSQRSFYDSISLATLDQT